MSIQFIRKYFRMEKSYLESIDSQQLKQLETYIKMYYDSDSSSLGNKSIFSYIKTSKKQSVGARYITLYEVIKKVAKLPIEVLAEVVIATKTFRPFEKEFFAAEFFYRKDYFIRKISENRLNIIKLHSERVSKILDMSNTPKNVDAFNLYVFFRNPDLLNKNLKRKLASNYSNIQKEILESLNVKNINSIQYRFPVLLYYGVDSRLKRESLTTIFNIQNTDNFHSELVTYMMFAEVNNSDIFVEIICRALSKSKIIEYERIPLPYKTLLIDSEKQLNRILSIGWQKKIPLNELLIGDNKLPMRTALKSIVIQKLADNDNETALYAREMFEDIENIYELYINKKFDIYFDIVRSFTLSKTDVNILITLLIFDTNSVHFTNSKNTDVNNIIDRVNLAFEYSTKVQNACFLLIYGESLPNLRINIRKKLSNDRKAYGIVEAGRKRQKNVRSINSYVTNIYPEALYNALLEDKNVIEYQSNQGKNIIKILKNKYNSSNETNRLKLLYGSHLTPLRYELIDRSAFKNDKDFVTILKTAPSEKPRQKFSSNAFKNIESLKKALGLTTFNSEKQEDKEVGEKVKFLTPLETREQLNVKKIINVLNTFPNLENEVKGINSKKALLEKLNSLKATITESQPIVTALESVLKNINGNGNIKKHFDKLGF